MTDEALMAAYRKGDVGAFERLLARHEKPIWNFLRRFVADRTTAEDLLQEVFLRVVKSAEMGDWKGTAKFSTWLYTIARNLCVDQSRRAVHRKAASLDAPTRPGDESSGSLHDQLPAPEAAAEAQVASREVGGRIEVAIAGLPADQREVFLMREVMEMPFAEIALVVGASEPTVKSRMRYALDKLRQALVDLRDVSPPGPAESAGSG
jgi:RNA polymerase sigma-70 factor (ECF subfamily)